MTSTVTDPTADPTAGRGGRRAGPLPLDDPPTAHHRAPAADPGPAHADLRAGVPDRDDADHRRVVRHRAGRGVPGEPVALVRRVVLHRRDRRHRPDHAAGAHRVVPRARRAAPVRRVGLPALVVRPRPARDRADRRSRSRASCCWRSPRRSTASRTSRVPLRVAAGIVVGSVAFVSIGVLLGTLLPSARAAQAIGLLLFFPSFLLGVGGPPPAVMSDALREIAELLPLALANQAIREPWLGIGNATGALLATAAIAVVATALAARRTAL